MTEQADQDDHWPQVPSTVHKQVTIIGEVSQSISRNGICKVQSHNYNVSSNRLAQYCCKTNKIILTCSWNNIQLHKNNTSDGGRIYMGGWNESVGGMKVWVRAKISITLGGRSGGYMY